MATSSNAFDAAKAKDFINGYFDTEILPALMDYIRIPNLSRAFDQNWNTNGLLVDAAKFLIAWVERQKVPGLRIELLKDEDKSPLIFMEIDGTAKTDAVLFYGHFDKQPPFQGWLEGLGPTIPVVRDDKLYGRGGADDGYSIFSAVTAVKMCLDQGVPIPRCVFMIEGDEESGSAHFEPYLNSVRERIGQVGIVFCLDSGCATYDTFYKTSSLRGALMTSLTVKILNEGVHSGDASGIVPDSFRIVRALLDRVENSTTGELTEEFQVNIPPNRYAELIQYAEVAGDELKKRFPLVPGARPLTDNAVQLAIQNGWRATLVVTGADGLPPTASAGNVLRPETTVKLSIRLPPTADPKTVFEALQARLLANPPYGAAVSLSPPLLMGGYNAPQNQAYLDDAVTRASREYFGKDAVGMPMGGSIPLMGLLNRLFPSSQFVITGILGPNSNAHGPNEFLHIPMTKKVTCCMAQVLAETFPYLSGQRQ